MNSSWQDFLGASGAQFEQGMVMGFGDFSAEFIAARDATVLSPLSHLGLIECAGEDAKNFLHNQLTSDINHLAPGSAQHSAWCNAKGRMQASFLLFRNDTDYRALLSSDLLPGIRNDLQKYVMRSRVRITDLSNTQEIFGLSGSQAETALKNASLPVPTDLLATAEFPQGTVIRLDAARFVIVVSSEKATEYWKSLCSVARPVGTPIWHWLDIQEGIPLITKATKEAFVPQMVNFDKIGGVSFHKGCYPGQEVVARTQYLGKVKRHLYRIHAEAAFNAGTTIYSFVNPETSFGMVVTAAPAPEGGFDGLAVVQENFIEGCDLRFDAIGQTALSISGISLVSD